MSKLGASANSSPDSVRSRIVDDSVSAASAKTISSGPSAILENGWFAPDEISATLKTLLVIAVLTVAPAILLMTTSFVRLSVVMSFLRQALGAGQIPSNQTITALAIFLTLLIMAPVGAELYETAVAPYSAGEVDLTTAFERGQAPVRSFLWKQIEKTGNFNAVQLFSQYTTDAQEPQYVEDIPWRVLAPAFLLSELKTAFLIGFQIFIPFLIIDMVVSCVLVSMGMMMLPPSVVSLPFKLALFVLADGWTLVVKGLIDSFA
ncbi:MAG: flagellar type III secretion system pore protein FliP [Thermoguttaceae bacterium]|nr:flagellar type III secretion system pore protein FliP [Thermoguttaceae bacterium]